MIVLVLTVVTTSLILFSPPSANISTPSSISQSPSFVDDLTLDTFVNLYAQEILQLKSYTLTVQSREKIRALLASMGTINIVKMKEVMFKGNGDEMLKAVENFVEENFLWEEKALMLKYIE